MHHHGADTQRGAPKPAPQTCRSRRATRPLSPALSPGGEGVSATPEAVALRFPPPPAPPRERGRTPRPKTSHYASLSPPLSPRERGRTLRPKPLIAVIARAWLRSSV